jgi:hypothetical protein
MTMMMKYSVFQSPEATGNYVAAADAEVLFCRPSHLALMEGVVSQIRV